MKKQQWMIFACLLMITGCMPKQAQKTGSEPYILFVAPLETHPLWLQTKAGFYNACEQENYHCDWIGPNSIDTARMNEVMKTGILQKANAIITQGVVDEALIEMAGAQQIPVVLVDSDMPNSARTAYFGKDFHEQANMLLQDIMKQWGTERKLNIAVQVTESSFHIAQEQVEQVRSVFQDYPGGYEIVEMTYSKSDPVRAKQEWTSAFKQHPEINVSLNFAGESVAACYESALQEGVRDNMLIYGVDDMSATLSLLEQGVIDGTITTSFYGYGSEPVQFLTDYFKDPDQKREACYSAQIQLITPENVKEYVNETNR